MRINWIGSWGLRIIALTLSANKPLARTHKLGSKTHKPENSLVLLRPIPSSLADYHKEAVAYTKVSHATGLFVTANTVERARTV
jgi:hypothetical protein